MNEEQFKILLKEVKTTNEKVDRIEDNLKTTNEKVDRIEDNLKTTNEKVDRIEDNLKATNEKVDRIEENLEKTNEKMDKGFKESREREEYIMEQLKLISKMRDKQINNIYEEMSMKA